MSKFPKSEAIRILNMILQKSDKLQAIEENCQETKERLLRAEQNVTLLSELLRKSLLRNEACFRPENLAQPCTADPDSLIGDYSIGYSCNLLNNSYLFCKIARKHGRKAMLFLEPNFMDTVITALPDWEEVFFQGQEMPVMQSELPPWEPPDFVQSAAWKLEYQTDVSISFEYDRMRSLLEQTPVTVNDYVDYLMAYSILPHHDLLQLYNTVDILHVSGTHIRVASFTDKPYIAYPFGGDLFTTPFEDTEIGWMQARGFRKATRHILGARILLEYMEILGIPRQKIHLIPFMVDTDVYAPRPDNPLREELGRKYEGRVCFLLGARQNWYWKGNEKVFRAVAQALKQNDEAVFLSVWYGQDVSQSMSLLEELGIEDRIVRIGVLSKEALRQHIDAVDVCLDQFTHGGLGTFALESMSCATPVITYYNADKHFSFEKEPPLLNAHSEEQIYECIMHCIENRNDLKQLGNEHRRWIKQYHGHEVLWPEYDDVYRRALMDARYRNR
jgi:glycosyltransferase involved in cell wall biosynthesis